MVKKLTDYLEKQYAQNPNKCAIADEDKEYTFEQLYWASADIADKIQQELHNAANCPILICLKKGIIEYCALIGTLCSGNFYVPVDMNMPVERMKKIFELTKPNVVITSGEFRIVVEEMGFDVRIIEINELCLEKGKDFADKWVTQIIDTDPAYMLFTSGSTGIPKGVVVSHRAVIDYIEWQCGRLPFDQNSVMGSQAPFYFDASMPDIYTPLRCGAKLVIIPEMFFLLPNKLLEYMEKKEINTLIWVPSALMTLTAKDYLVIKKLEHLKLVMFCGEVMPNKHLNIWRKHYPDVMFVNLYGPTEAAYACTYFIVDREFSETDLLPIGYPCENTDVLVLNEDDEQVQCENVEGELCIRGSSLANGYYNNHEKTRETFVKNPLNKMYDEVIYRTGDIVRYNEYGELVYVGRKDFQIKHMGYRIELGEIENAAYGIDGIEQCCAVYDNKNMRIVLVCTLNKSLTDKEIYTALKNKIPKYMLPGNIWITDKLPLNANGKVDREWIRKRFRIQRGGEMEGNPN